jgi:hypothetical protein
MRENKYTQEIFPAIFLNNKILFIPAIILILLAMTPAIIDWKKVQQLKVRYLSQASQNAMEQQKTSHSPAINVKMDGNAIAAGAVSMTYLQDGALLLDLNASPRGSGPALEKVQIKLTEQMDMLTGYSGLAVFVKNEGNTSGEVRAGLILTNLEGMKTEIRPVLPVLSAWGDDLHELYFDWGSLNYDKAEEAARVLKSVSMIEITFASARRAPERHGSAGLRPARFSLSNLRLVDYLTGSYDPRRQSLTFDSDAGKWMPNSQYDFTLQHRTQEVTGIVAAFGGEHGIKSAVASLDMAIRTQCWDGSFLDGRRGAVTVASGEYTFGFTIYGLLQGYRHLEEIKHPSLDEIITIGPTSMTRREFCQRMFYRAAMARTAATPTYYRDDIIGGNTLISGANRVLGYAIAMRMVADVIYNPEWKKEVMDMYTPIMQEIADAQGKYSGGFPLLGEGDRFQGRGIHYDAGYTRTHMDWLVVGALQTGDPLMVEMLRKYQTVFEAAMNEHGVGIFRMVSERGTGTSPVSLILPDATYQVGVKYNLPVIAQWGFNCSQRAWAESKYSPRNHFTFASGARGYSLGAHISILQDDMLEEPIPKDMGYLFPRQFPLWSTRIYSKEGELLRTSVMNFRADGTQVSDYHIGIGEYPETIGVPVMIKSSGSVTAIAKKLSGWPKLLPERAKIQMSGGINARGVTGKLFTVTLEKETTIVVKGPDTKLPAELGGEKKPFLAEFTLTPEKAGQIVEITILAGTMPYTYKLETR